MADNKMLTSCGYVILNCCAIFPSAGSLKEKILYDEMETFLEIYWRPLQQGSQWKKEMVILAEADS